MPASKEDVVWCYRLILGREPESDDVIKRHMAFADRQSLVQGFLLSEEFRNSAPLAMIRAAVASEGLPQDLKRRAFTGRFQLAKLISKAKATWANGSLSIPQQAAPVAATVSSIERPDLHATNEVQSEPAPLASEDIDRAAEIYWKHGAVVEGPWGEFHGRYLPLPDWIDPTLDAFSPEYAKQQKRLWCAIAGRSAYSAESNEQTPEISASDPIYRPAFYEPRHIGAVRTAGDHIIAMGYLLKQSGVVAGDRVLEYGAGFGQIALAFARLGAIVDTVDINPSFCDAVRAQAEFFKVPLTPHVAGFGDNPRPSEKYKLVVFYEAFHHCLDFSTVISQLKGLLVPGGKVLLAGEPIVEDINCRAVPYPWGLRLDAETVAVIRKRGWMELGFQWNFLAECFARQGFTPRKHHCNISDYAIIYEFSLDTVA